MATDEMLTDGAVQQVVPLESDAARFEKQHEWLALVNKVPKNELALRTGLCYDVRMRAHNTVDVFDNHPESPSRIRCIFRALALSGLVDDAEYSLNGKPGSGVLRRISARHATREEILRGHSLDLWDTLSRLPTLDYEELLLLTNTWDSIFLNKESFYCGLLSAGGAIETCNAVVEDQVRNAIAVIRPPGHHAEPGQAMGFCLFNNVGIAVLHVLETHPDQVKRVLVLDWDVHHGNGTQTMFYQNPNVLYISIHRYDDGQFYPIGHAGNFDRCGSGPGLGKNVNIPWPHGGMGDAEYLYAFQQIVMPIAYEFGPDLVVVSAGFDAAAGDELGGCFVNPPVYAHMTSMLMNLAQGKVVIVLEGGYSLEAISFSALACTLSLLGQPPARIEYSAPLPSCVKTIRRVKMEQSKYWKCLQPQYLDVPLASDDLMPITLNSVIRDYQIRRLKERWRMIEMAHIVPPGVLMCTVDAYSADTLMVYVHESPTTLGVLHDSTNAIQLKWSYLVDISDRYMSYARSKNWAVVEIQLDSTRDATLSVLRLWDHFCDIVDARQLVFIGTGVACTGVTYLVTQRNITSRVACIVNFVGDGVPRSVGFEQYLVDWYYDHSLVFVSGTKKYKKRFGSVEKVDFTCMSNLLASQFERFRKFVEYKLSSGS